MKLSSIAFLLLTIIAISGCSDKDKEAVRVKAAEAAITHNPAECPKVSGLYKRKEGFTKGALTFAITDDGKNLRFADSATGIDGHNFRLDGSEHNETENGKTLKYVAGCQKGTLRLVGSIGDGKEKIDMTISEKEGGVVSIKSGDAEGEYEKVVGEGK